MLDLFKTVKMSGHQEIVIKRSRFIGHAAPVESEEDAQQFVEAIRQQHPQASHNCYAYIVGERDEWQKFSDDGEPSGTAGKPILEVIKHQGLKNVVVVVTRYFGGVLLGAGGLVRAYTDGAVAGIEAAEPVMQALHRTIMVEVDYIWLGKLENELRQRQVLTGETSFADNVTLLCIPRVTEADAFVQWMIELTNGQARITHVNDTYVTRVI